MKSVEFPQANVKIAENQPEYETLHAHSEPMLPGTPVTVCFELSDEEIAEIVKTKKIWYQQLLFGRPFQPICMSTQNPY